MRILAPTFAMASLCVVLFPGCDIPKFSATRDFEKVIPINSQVDVIVKTSNGSITVTPTDKLEIEMVAHAKAYGMTQEEAEAALETLMPEIDTTTTSITLECTRRAQKINYSDSVSLELKVPARWPLKLETSNGSVSTNQSQGPVTISTSNGRIEVKGATGSLHLSTSNGRITIENSTGNIQAGSSNGSIQLIGCALEGKCKLDTSNGAIGVNLSVQAPIQLEASTSNGSIRFDKSDLDVTKKSKRHVSGVLFGKASGPSPNVSLDLETSNGSITISPQESDPLPTETKSSEAA